jgi:hypothetical protein
LTLGRRSVGKIITESLLHVVPTPLSGIRIGKRKVGGYIIVPTPLSGIRIGKRKVGGYIIFYPINNPEI